MLIKEDEATTDKAMFKNKQGSSISIQLCNSLVQDLVS